MTAATRACVATYRLEILADNGEWCPMTLDGDAAAVYVTREDAETDGEFFVSPETWRVATEQP